MPTLSTTAETNRGNRISQLGAISLWSLQGLVAVFLFFGGVMKIAGDPEMVALFSEVGVGQWFRYVTGALEMGGGVLLVVPRYSLAGALILAAVMAGAVLTHLLVVGGSAFLPLILLGLLLTIAWVRR